MVIKLLEKGLFSKTRKIDYNSQLKVTVAKYYTPSGRCIQKINYSEEEKENVPDSLKNEFKTINGRSVFDGGGIEPDIKIIDDSIPTILYDLAKKRLFFEFEINFSLKMDTLYNTFEFQISDNIYSEFVEFLKNNEFEFETESEKQLDKLKEVVNEENYEKKLENEFLIFEKILEEIKKEDIYKFKKEISLLILDDLVTRQYYNKGRIEALLKHDKALIESLKLLGNMKKYNEILNPN